jgi:2-succinyl-5-enolpyruvyl-6-hydroxy-3-cyclohexene-1-carboxylate synthase
MPIFNNKSMIYPKIPLAQSIIQICQAKGLNHIVISPGSRNAPLTIGFVNNPNFTCYSIADERCAAFFAMGIAQQTGKPAVVVCTSGSALLNFYPAVAEAFYSQIPLVVISADRPPHMIDIGDGQTIRQENVLENHSLYNVNLTPEASHENDDEINEAINKSYTSKGPVHINAPFEEPLYETARKLSVDVNISAIGKVFKTISVEDLMAFTNIWNAASRKLVLIGVNEPDEIDQEILDMLARDNSVTVMTETTSNLHHPAFVNHIDRIITPFTSKEFFAFQPEIVVTFGGMVVSKRIKAFLRKYKPEHHWHIDPLRAYNTFDSLTKHFECNPNEFFQQFLPFTKDVLSEYNKSFAKIKSQRQKKHEQYLASAPYSDFTVFGKIIPALPKDIQLQISNSAAIRYAQLFDIDPSIDVFCNRGTSGIDGSTSTAIGAAVASKKQTVLITGDVGFLYDSNALWNNYIPKNFKIIVVNNGGGGIFRILPGHVENEVFNTFFETSHCLTAEHLAKMYRFDYFSASDHASLESAQKTFYAQQDRPCILEIFTPTKDNDKVLKDYFQQLG